MIDEDEGASYSDKDTEELDDVGDRDELRRRYYGLLQELRVILPGVQVLLAFLLTTPFAQRFVELDTAGRWAFGIALTCAMFSVLCLIGPVILHRLGERTARTSRLWWSIRLTVAGILLLGVALISALWGISRFVYGDGTAWWLVTPVIVTALAVWVALPLAMRRRHRIGVDGE